MGCSNEINGLRQMIDTYRTDVGPTSKSTFLVYFTYVEEQRLIIKTTMVIAIRKSNIM